MLAKHAAPAHHEELLPGNPKRSFQLIEVDFSGVPAKLPGWRARFKTRLSPLVYRRGHIKLAALYISIVALQHRCMLSSTSASLTRLLCPLLSRRLFVFQDAAYYCMVSAVHILLLFDSTIQMQVYPTM